MLKDFMGLWKGKGLPIYSAIWRKFNGSEIINTEEEVIESVSYAPSQEIQLISPFREKEELDFQVQGNRDFPNLNASSQAAIKVEDLIEFEGDLFKVFEVEKQDLLGIFYFKSKYISEDEIPL